MVRASVNARKAGREIRAGTGEFAMKQGIRTKQVHHRSTDELRGEQRLRLFIDIERRTDLAGPPRIHHDHAVCHRRRRHLNMGDVKRRDARLGMKLPDLLPHLDRQFCVEVRARLIEPDACQFMNRGLDFRPVLLAVPHRLSLARPIHKPPSMTAPELMKGFAQSLAPFRP